MGAFGFGIGVPTWLVIGYYFFIYYQPARIQGYVKLDKLLSRVWSRDREKEDHTKKEEWEIDLAKLDIRNVIAHGNYNAAYRGVYDGQDVAVKVLDWREDGLAPAAETTNLRTSFRQEVAVWHKLDHPNVTKLV